MSMIPSQKHARPSARPTFSTSCWEDLPPIPLLGRAKAATLKPRFMSSLTTNLPDMHRITSVQVSYICRPDNSYGCLALQLAVGHRQSMCSRIHAAA